jgi:Divergent InlB B-repeat domain
MRVSKRLFPGGHVARRLVVLAALACGIALAGAQSADAAFAYGTGFQRAGSADRTAQHCFAGSLSSSASSRQAQSGEGPCYYVQTEVWGNGTISSTTPALVPGGSTPAERYPNGHIDCPSTADWNCAYFFNWSFGDSTTVILQANCTGTNCFLGWEGCPHVQGAGNRQCRREQEDPEPLANCIIAHFAPDTEVTESGCGGDPPPPPPPINVKVEKAGSGSGLVQSNPIGIFCGNSCGTTITPGQNVTLTATPASGSVFAGWSAECADNVPPNPDPCSPPCPTSGTTCTWGVVAGTERIVTARFNLPAPPPPNTVILRKPAKLTKSRNASFFWAAKRGSTFLSNFTSQCRLDKKVAWLACKSGKTYKGLKPGAHTFRVRTHDANGWDPTPAVYSWKIKR